jgi:hypothetical protein
VRRLVLLMVGLFAIGCNTTTVNSVDLRKTKLLVVALGSVPENRVRFEDLLVQKLGSGGIAAIPSHPLLPSFDGATREDVIRLARDNAVTSVVAITAVSVNAASELVPLGPVAPESGGKLAAFIDASIEQGHIREGNVVFVTRVHQLSTGDLVWGGVSWAVPLDDLDAVIDETTTVISDNILSAERQLLRLSERGVEPAGG